MRRECMNVTNRSSRARVYRFSRARWKASSEVRTTPLTIRLCQGVHVAGVTVWGTACMRGEPCAADWKMRGLPICGDPWVCAETLSTHRGDRGAQLRYSGDGSSSEIECVSSAKGKKYNSKGIFAWHGVYPRFMARANSCP